MGYLSSQVFSITAVVLLAVKCCRLPKARNYLFLAILFILTQPDHARSANWNTNEKKLDVNSLSLNPVPKSFPQYAMTLDESCETSKGQRWITTIPGFYGDGLFWASIHSNGGDWVRIYEGKRLTNGGYLIRAGEAAKKMEGEIQLDFIQIKRR